uniref:Uncharacterized protein n=1 Tax=Opuntia streptacantha TaxID=393608 RepID=A0A7C8YJS8_OPUST
MRRNFWYSNYISMKINQLTVSSFKSIYHQYSLKWMAPTFQTMYVVANITVLMKTKEKAIRNKSEPPGKLKVSPALGNPLLLSSKRFVGASGRPFFPFSLSLRASNTLRPISDLAGLDSE